MRLAGFLHQSVIPEVEQFWKDLSLPENQARLTEAETPKEVWQSVPTKIIQNTGEVFSLAAFDRVLPELETKPKNSRYKNFERSFPFPHPELIPMEVCLSHENRKILDQGQPEGNRNQAGFALACDLLGVADYLTQQEQAFEGDPHSLFLTYCHRCQPPLSDSEADSIWQSANKEARGAVLSPEYIENCVKGYVWRIREGDQGSDAESTPAEQANQWISPVAHQGELGEWKKVKEGEKEFLKFFPKANFDFTVERELSNRQGGGVIIRVQRSLDSESKCIVLKSTEFTNADRFVDALKSKLGTSISCNLSKAEINALIHVRLRDYRQQGGKTYKLAERQGRQADGTWVFQDRQFNGDGSPTSEEASGWVFCEDLGGEDYIPKPTIGEFHPEALRQYLQAKQRFFGSNFMPSLLVDGFVVATLHDQEIMQKERSFPLINLHGDPGGLKSISVESSLAIVGWVNAEDGIISKASESMLYERLKYMGSLPTCWDDPPRDKETEEICKRIFNRYPRIVRENHQTPQGSLILTSNHLIGENNPATRSRIIPIYMPVIKDGDKAAWQDLMRSRQKVSGWFQVFLQLGYPQERIKALEVELLAYLPAAHARTAKSLALITHYAMEVVRLSGLEIDIKQWVIDHLCAELNDSQSGLDCVSDFLTKLQVLESENRVGEWNKIGVETEKYGPVIALHLPSIWQTFDREFQPAYNKSTLEKALESRGAIKGVTQKFWSDRDQTLVYHRSQLHHQDDNTPPPEPPKINRKCYLLPQSLWEVFGASSQHPPPLPVTSVTSSNLGQVTDQNLDQVTNTGGLAIASNLVTQKNDDEYKQGLMSQRERLSSAEDETAKLPDELEVTQVTQANIQPETPLEKPLEQSPELGYSLVTEEKEVTGEMAFSVQADCHWTPKIDDRVLALSDNSWQFGKVIQVPITHRDPNKKTRYWKVRLETGSEVNLWELEKLRQIA